MNPTVTMYPEAARLVIDQRLREADRERRRRLARHRAASDGRRPSTLGRRVPWR
jgi:hypothetical protein